MQDDEMNQDFLTYECERQDEMLSVLYGEATDEEIERFGDHRRECRSCTQTYNSFGAVRTSVRELRDQALNGFQPGTAVLPAQPKSARAALRLFFDLSPLWLKAGTALATAVLCVFGYLAFRQTSVTPVSSKLTEPDMRTDKVYSEAELRAAVAKAVDAANNTAQRAKQDVMQPEKPREHLSANSNSSSSVKSRRPLSRNEREQLASDLRLVNRSDDDGLELLSDRINQ
jgi:hypothetical protein